MAEGKTARIGLVSMIMMPAVAVFFDLLSFIPLVGSLGWIVFTIWFFILGVSPLSIRRLATMGVSVVVELFPYVSVLPSITAGVIAIIIMVKSEDKLGIKLPLPK